MRCRRKQHGSGGLILWYDLRLSNTLNCLFSWPSWDRLWPLGFSSTTPVTVVSLKSHLAMRFVRKNHFRISFSLWKSVLLKSLPIILKVDVLKLYLSLWRDSCLFMPKNKTKKLPLKSRNFPTRREIYFWFCYFLQFFNFSNSFSKNIFFLSYICATPFPLIIAL